MKTNYICRIIFIKNKIENDKYKRLNLIFTQQNFILIKKFKKIQKKINKIFNSRKLEHLGNLFLVSRVYLAKKAATLDSSVTKVI
jgi:hypothetical protein